MSKKLHPCRAHDFVLGIAVYPTITATQNQDDTCRVDYACPLCGFGGDDDCADMAEALGLSVIQWNSLPLHREDLERVIARGASA